MQRSFKTFGDAFKVTHRPTPVAANDNRPRKEPPARYRGTLPALRWLFENHPDLAPALADAVQSLSSSNWRADAIDTEQEVRPTVGELLKAATASTFTGDDGIEYRTWHDVVVEPKPADATYKSDERIILGDLTFNRGRLDSWGETKKGRKLQPRDKIASREEDVPAARNPQRYLKTKPTTPSPLHAEPLPRNMSAEPALIPMLTPLPGVEEARAVLQSFGVDGDVPFCRLPVPGTRGSTVVANGASFLGGIARSSGTASSGAPIMWEGPAERPSETRRVVEEVAARGTLKDIGLRLGYTEGRAIEGGKMALVEAARMLVAANDNGRRRKAAA